MHDGVGCASEVEYHGDRNLARFNYELTNEYYDAASETNSTP